MAERYKRVFTLEGVWYIEGSPVTIEAGALLADTQTGGVLAQVKYKNLSQEKIIAMTAEVEFFDVAGRNLEKPVKHQYLDLSVAPCDEFGSKNAIVLADNSARHFNLRVTEVVFEGGNIWTNDKPFERLPEQKELSIILADNELLKQYQMDIGLQGQFVPDTYADLHYCVCGERYKANLESCPKCGNSFEKLTERLDIGTLNENKNNRERQEEQERIAKKKKAKKRKKIAAIITPIVVACIAFVVVLKTVIIPNQQYKEALRKYGDSIKAASVGDTIKFGHYEQDNNSSNGKEEIEWIVLAKDGDKVLVISKYALDWQEYDSSPTSVTWETCSLRKWMNGTFLNAAFDSGEQRLIQKSTVTADKNPSYSTSPGNNTTDKVFLLSVTEANKYFNSDSAIQCRATKYAKAQVPLYTNTSNGNCCWWLRSPGEYSSFAAYVSSDGYVRDDGDGVVCFDYAVRPALWINLAS